MNYEQGVIHGIQSYMNCSEDEAIKIASFRTFFGNLANKFKGKGTLPTGHTPKSLPSNLPGVFTDRGLMGNSWKGPSATKVPQNSTAPPRVNMDAVFPELPPRPLNYTQITPNAPTKVPGITQVNNATQIPEPTMVPGARNAPTAVPAVTQSPAASIGVKSTNASEPGMSWVTDPNKVPGNSNVTPANPTPKSPVQKAEEAKKNQTWRQSAVDGWNALDSGTQRALAGVGGVGLVGAGGAATSAAIDEYDRRNSLLGRLGLA